MEIILHPVYGNQENLDIQIHKPELILKYPSDETQALERGWSIYKNSWFLSRMVRLDLSAYNKVPKTIKNHTIDYVEKFECTTEYYNLYKYFLSIKNLPELYTLNSDLERSSAITIRKNNTLVGFSKMVKYYNSIETQYTIIDYKEPKLSLGRKIVDYEVYFAKELGYTHLYIGCGYGLGGKYKSNFKGFEYWTGKEWSNNTIEYCRLCERDQSITNLETLNKVYNE